MLSPYLSDRSLTQGVRANLSHPSLGSFPEAGIGLGDCWSTIRAHGRLIFALIFVALALTGLAVLLATPNYTAYVILRIDPEAPKILDISQFQVQNSEDHDYYKTEFELLSSEELAANVIQDLNLQAQPLFESNTSKKTLLATIDDFLASMIMRATGSRASTMPPNRFLGTSKSLIDKYLAGVSIEPIPSTRLVRVSYRSPDPSLAAKIANSHVKDFLLLNQSLRRQAGEGARSFLEQELSEIKSKVQKSEADLNEYRTRKGILAFGTGDQEKNRIAEQRMEELTEALTDAQNQRIKAQAQLATLRAGDFDSVPAVITNPMIESLRPEYDRLQAQYAELRSRYTDKYPAVGETKSRLDAAKKRLNVEAMSIARAVERTYSTTLAREKQLEQQVAKEKQADIELNDISLQDAILVREVETNRQLYHDVLQRMHELSVENDAPMPNISVVESAQVPPYPSSPKKLKSLAIAGLLAIVIGIGLSFVIEQSNDCLKSVEEIEHYLHLPELGIVPDFGKLNNRRSASVPSLTAALYHSAHARRGGTPMMEPSSGWTSPGASLERRMKFYKSIRTAILYSRAGGAPKTILFVSALPAEGKTMTAVSTALAFAQTGASTLLVDTDLRAPRCHTMLDADNLIGLSDIIVNRAQSTRAIRRMDAWHLDDYQGLYLLGAGPAVPNPSELLTSVKMHQLLQQLGQSYQFILLDSAPIVFSSETVGLATMVDGVVVVASVSTPKQVIRSVCKRLSIAGATVYGIVLNKVDIRQTAYHKLDPYYAARPTQQERSIDEVLTI